MEKMKPFRQRIDDLDDQIVDLLAQRIAIIHEVAHFKYAQNIPAILQDRIDEVKDRVTKLARDKDSDPEIVKELYTRLIQYSCDLEDDIMSGLDEQGQQLAQ